MEEQQRIAAINRLLYQTSSTENDLDSAQKKQELVAYVFEYHKQHKQRVFPKYVLLFFALRLLIEETERQLRELNAKPITSAGGVFLIILRCIVNDLFTVLQVSFHQLYHILQRNAFTPSLAPLVELSESYVSDTSISDPSRSSFNGEGSRDGNIATQQLQRERNTGNVGSSDMSSTPILVYAPNATGKTEQHSISSTKTTGVDMFPSREFVSRPLPVIRPIVGTCLEL